MKKRTVGYYAVIPASVRYDNKVCANAKLLYGEITALCNKEGYCWATNKYFAELYGVSARTVTKWIKQLTDNGYLKSEIVYKAGTREIAARYLRLPEAAPVQEVSTEVPEAEECPAPIEDNFRTPPEEKFYTPIEEKFQYNNTGNNNTSMNILSFSLPEGRKEETKKKNIYTKNRSLRADPHVEACPELDLSGLKLNEKLRSAANQVQTIIRRLWETSKITVKGKVCRQEYIRAQLSRLTALDVQAVLEKLQQNCHKIKNLPSYLASMLLQAPDETALWQIQKAGTAEAAPEKYDYCRKPSYDIDEWERLSLLPIQTAWGY